MSLRNQTSLGRIFKTIYLCYEDFDCTGYRYYDRINNNILPMVKTIISFDDGHVSDMRAARLLHDHFFKGVFYLPSAKAGNVIPMTLQEVKTGIVDLGHEIGGHTVTHPMDMKLLSDDDLGFEIVNNRQMIMGMFKQQATKFCYPRGRHDERVREAVKAAGYAEARTTRVLEITNSLMDPYQTPTTIHMFQREEYKGRHWLELAEEYYLKALNASRTDETVFFSIWGHTKELDAQNDWERFEGFLKFMRMQG